jgi:alpha-tubulin suppressor-like RCC1 family protein
MEEGREHDFYYTLDDHDKKSDRKIIQLSAGRNHVIALDAANRIYVWGDNAMG